MNCPFRPNKKLSFWQKIINNILDRFPRRTFLTNQAHLEAILNSTIDSIITTNEHGIIQSCNLTTKSMFGYCESELIGQNISILQPEPFRSEHDTYIKNYLTTGIKRIIGKTREVLGCKKDGKTFPIDIFVNEMMINNQRFFLGIIRDVSERQEALIAKEIALKASLELKAKNEFLGIVSHELKTPLHSIIGFTEYLLEESEGPITPAQKSSLDLVYDSGKRLLVLINGLLTLAKTQAIQPHLPKESCNLKTILETCINIISPLAKKKHLIIEPTLPTTPCFVEASSTHIHEIFLNLLSNAVNYTNIGKITISLSYSNKEAKITIQDTGCGIDAALLDKLFVPFARINPEPDINHTGLGLSITKSLIEGYYGKIDVISQKGIGSTFIVYLPLITTS